MGRGKYVCDCGWGFYSYGEPPELPVHCDECGDEMHVIDL